MWQILIAVAGIIGLLVFWTAVVAAIASLVFFAVSFIPMTGRRRPRGREPLTDTASDRLRHIPGPKPPDCSESRGTPASDSQPYGPGRE